MTPALDELAPMLLTMNVTFDPIQFTNAGGGELTAYNVDILPQGLAVAVSTDASTCVKRHGNRSSRRHNAYSYRCECVR